jgi:hypothetical protein
MVDHHIDNRGPLDQEVPHTSGVGVFAYVIVALIIGALAALWFWGENGISLRIFSDTQGTLLPTDNPIQPLRSNFS